MCDEEKKIRCPDRVKSESIDWKLLALLALWDRNTRYYTGAKHTTKVNQMAAENDVNTSRQVSSSDSCPTDTATDTVSDNKGRLQLAAGEPTRTITYAASWCSRWSSSSLSTSDCFLNLSLCARSSVNSTCQPPNNTSVVGQVTGNELTSNDH